MPKESTFYFSHDYNARNDRKIAALVKDYKGTGYGIFWATCELMHEEGGSIELDDISFGAIAKDINESPELIKEVLFKCIEVYKLFTKHNEADAKQKFLLQSGRIFRNLEGREKSKQNKAEAGRKGGIKSGESRRYKLSERSTTKQTEAERSSALSNEAKERKGKEIKGKEIKGDLYVPVISSMPKSSDFNGLPEIKTGSAIQLLKITQGVLVTTDDISGLWEVFKIQNLTGKKFYQTEDDVYSHFLNWVKGQKIQKDGKGTTSTVGKEITFDKL